MTSIELECRSDNTFPRLLQFTKGVVFHAFIFLNGEKSFYALGISTDIAGTHLKIGQHKISKTLLRSLVFSIYLLSTGKKIPKKHTRESCKSSY